MRAGLWHVAVDMHPPLVFVYLITLLLPSCSVDNIYVFICESQSERHSLNITCKYGTGFFLNLNIAEVNIHIFCFHYRSK